MAGSSSSSSSLKTLNSINLFPIKQPSSSSPSSSTSLSSMKLKTLLQTFIFSHMYRVARALSKAKSVLIHLFKNLHFLEFPLRRSKQKKLYFGSFRLHYNWGSSSRTVPRGVYCDYPGWSSTSFRYDVGAGQEYSGELSKYLQWLEERGDEESCNEIDRLADLFIADCHEKFRLEKQESYRRFQEMMARSV